MPAGCKGIVLCQKTAFSNQPNHHIFAPGGRNEDPLILSKAECSLRACIILTHGCQPNRSKCFQLMETDDIALFDEWIVNWNDLIDFEIIPVEDSPTKFVESDPRA